MPGVTRTRKRVAARRARAVELVERVDDDQRAERDRALDQRVLLVVAVDDEPLAVEAGALGERELAHRRDVGAEPLLGEHAAARRPTGTPSSRRRRARPAPRRGTRAPGRAASPRRRRRAASRRSRASSAAPTPPSRSSPSSIAAPSGSRSASGCVTSGIVLTTMLRALADLVLRRPRAVLASRPSSRFVAGALRRVDAGAPALERHRLPEHAARRASARCSSSSGRPGPSRARRSWSSPRRRRRPGRRRAAPRALARTCRPARRRLGRRPLRARDGVVRRRRAQRLRDGTAARAHAAGCGRRRRPSRTRR